MVVAGAFLTSVDHHQVFRGLRREKLDPPEQEQQTDPFAAKLLLARFHVISSVRAR